MIIEKDHRNPARAQLLAFDHVVAIVNVRDVTDRVFWTFDGKTLNALSSFRCEFEPIVAKGADGRLRAHEVDGDGRRSCLPRRRLQGWSPPVPDGSERDWISTDFELRR
jgi:hypothetical protein